MAVIKELPGCNNRNCFAGCQNEDVLKVINILQAHGCYFRELNGLICQAIVQEKYSSLITWLSLNLNGHGSRMEVSSYLKRLTNHARTTRS